MDASTSSENPPVICLGGCGHLLRSDLAKARGYGKDCWRKLHGHARRPTLPSPASVRPCAGQDELPLADQLDLWSQT